MEGGNDQAVYDQTIFDLIMHKGCIYESNRPSSLDAFADILRTEQGSIKPAIHTLVFGTYSHKRSTFSGFVYVSMV